MQRIKRALMATVGTLGLTAGALGGFAAVGATTAHAGPPPPSYSEAWGDYTASVNGLCYSNPGDICYVNESGSDVMAGTESSAMSLLVAFNGTNWCVEGDHGYFATYTSPGWIKDDHASCGTNEQYILTCQGGGGELFTLKSVANGEYVGYYSSTDGDLYAWGSADLFQDLNGHEC